MCNNIRKIHIRYEDRKTNSKNFGTGITLDSLKIWTNKKDRKTKVKQMRFNNLVILSR